MNSDSMDLFLEDANDIASMDALAAALVDALEPIEPPPALRQRVLDRIAGPGRLHRFADALARMLDVGSERARALLDQALGTDRWEPGPGPSMALWVDGGAAVLGCIRGFVRVPAGARFPLHRHVGEEVTLFLEGTSIEADGKIYQPGDIMVLPAGSDHEFSVPPGDTDLLFFVVIRQGIYLDDMLISHRDPPAG